MLYNPYFRLIKVKVLIYFFFFIFPFYYQPPLLVFADSPVFTHRHHWHCSSQIWKIFLRNEILLKFSFIGNIAFDDKMSVLGLPHQFSNLWYVFLLQPSPAVKTLCFSFDSDSFREFIIFYFKIKRYPLEIFVAFSVWTSKIFIIFR